jgi:hypothetical protein
MPTRVAHWIRPSGFVAAALFAAHAAAASEGPRYTYAEADYARVDFDNFSDDANVFAANGSFGVTDMLYLVGGYAYGTIDTSGPDVDLQNFDAGLGLHLPLDSKVDFIAEVAYAWAKVHVQHFGSEDDDGAAFKAGIRAMLTPDFELNAGGTYVDISGNDSTAGYVGAVYNFDPMFALTGTISVGDDATSYGIGLRFYFDPRR